MKSCSLVAAVPLLSMFGCATDEVEISSVAEPVTIELGPTDDNVFSNGPEGKELIGNLTHSFQLTAGNAVYVNMRADVTSPNNAESMLDKIYLTCSYSGFGPDQIKTTENHVGTGVNSYITRMLAVAPTPDPPPTPLPSINATCKVEGEAWPHGGQPIEENFDPNDYHTYLAGPGTYLTVSSAKQAGSFDRWGTEADATYGDNCCYGTGDGDDCNDDPRECTYIGNDSDLAAKSEEYVLRSGRFTAPSWATSLTVYSDVALTVCYSNTEDCPIYAQGIPLFRNAGADVQLTLIVEQFCDTTSTTVGRTTTDFLDFTVSSDEHHKKAHLKATPSVAQVCPACPNSVCVGRSFKMKTLVENESFNPVKVEWGEVNDDDELTGFSTSFVFAQ